jgi:hypothetical protein
MLELVTYFGDFQLSGSTWRQFHSAISGFMPILQRWHRGALR